MKCSKLLIVAVLSAFTIVGAGIVKSSQVASKASASVTAIRATQDEIESYYSSISDSLTGSDLRNALNTLNNQKKTREVGYAGMKTFSQYCDADPDGSGKILGFYDNTLVGPSWDSAKTWNREHVWPNARGGSSVEGDAHMPRPASVKANSSRGSKGFSYNSFDPGYDIEYYRGVCSRIIFYCMIANTNLKLTEDPLNYNGSTPANTMGKLSDMLKWNLEYLPTDTSFTGGNDVARRAELQRNEVIQNHSSGQGNRNPFIDHPEYACRIWGNTDSETKAICSSQPVPSDPKVVSIDIENVPTKTEYTVGDQLDLTGLKVVANYDQGNPTDVTNNVTASISTFTQTGNQTVTLSYSCDDGVFETSFDVTVSPKTINLVSVTASINESTLYKNQNVQINTVINPSNAYPVPSITFSSSNTSVATVSETGLISTKSVGNADITVTATQNAIVKNYVLQITVEDSGYSTIEELYTLDEGTSVKFRGLYIGSYSSQSNGIFVADGEHSVIVYNYKNSISTFTRYSTYVEVTGVIGLYKGLVEVGTSNSSPTITVIDKTVGEKWVNPVVPYEINGTESTTADIKLSSRPATVIGKITNSSPTIDGSSDVTVTLTLAGTNTCKIFIKRSISSDLDYSTLNSYLNDSNIGNTVMVRGYFSIFNNFQLILPIVCGVKNDYNASDFANDFLNKTSAICSSEGDKTKSLANTWADLYFNYYLDLSTSQYYEFQSAIPDEHGTDVEHAAARYDLITAKYHLDNFADRDISYLDGMFDDYLPIDNNYGTVVIIIISSLVFAITAVSLIVIRKKKH